MLELRPVAGRRMLKQFLQLPWAIYRDDPAWVPPLLLERRAALSPKEPAFEHLQWQAWIAWEGQRPLGRISAQVDALHLRQHEDATGFFGLLEGFDRPDLFAALAAAAEAWLRQRGMARILGPMNLHINQELGLLREGYETPPAFLMGHARPYYHEHLRTLGYQPCQELLAYEMATTYDEPKAVRRLRLRLADRLRLRSLDRSRKAAELETLRAIFNDGWSGNWGFAPFSKAEFDALGNLLLLAVPADFVLIAELDGEPAGFLALIPNLNEAIRDLNGRLLPFGWAKLLWRLKVRLPSTGRVPLMGVRKRLHDTLFGPGIAMSLIHQAGAHARRRGIRSAELSWILKDNAGMRSIIERLGGSVRKRYLMYDKRLDGR